MENKSPGIYIIDGQQIPHQFAETRWNSRPVRAGEVGVYVDYTNGSDTNAGTLEYPLKTIDTAFIVWRRNNPGRSL
jgi:hypothetical protein